MNKKLKLTVALLQILGGLAGFGIIGLAFLRGVSLTTAVIHTVFMFIFTYGIAAGLVLIKMERLGMILSVIFQAIQIPIIIGPRFSYCMFSGASLKVFKSVIGWGFDFGLGSYYNFYINSGEPRLMGMNIVALVLFILLIREIRFSSMYAKYLESQKYTTRPASQPTYKEDTEFYGIPLRFRREEG